MDAAEDKRLTPEADQVENQPAPDETFWGKLRRWLFPSAAERAELYQQRLMELDYAIELYPEAPSNYVFRGEYHLAAHFYDQAVSDFQQALELASQQLEVEDWGLITQTMRDRALNGLERALRLQHRQP